ncbi:hypothetical protein SKAU_G00019540 [Synaphobranchus kaupii]|uniref:Uncharacterized protein n=1 Tax=Synaphobranchus kaupii TaxID=118154 RepID=A0A9Q1JC23_SYNKA|nr:hypothetical protein SKAU_G00019540 [Synaphobranchus kaupii]
MKGGPEHRDAKGGRKLGTWRQRIGNETDIGTGPHGVNHPLADGTNVGLATQEKRSAVSILGPPLSKDTGLGKPAD